MDNISGTREKGARGATPSLVANYPPLIPYRKEPSQKKNQSGTHYLISFPPPSASSGPKKGDKVGTHLENERTARGNRRLLLRGDTLERVYKYTLYYFTRALVDTRFCYASEGHLLKIKFVKIVWPSTILRKSFH